MPQRNIDSFSVQNVYFFARVGVWLVRNVRSLARSNE